MYHRMGDLERVHDALFGGFSGGVRQLAGPPLIPRSNIKDITNVARRHLPQKLGDPAVWLQKCTVRSNRNYNLRCIDGCGFHWRA